MSDCPDCLNEIFKYLEDDKKTLYLCLLVNRLWCKISIKILWSNRNIWNFKANRANVPSQILSTLIACLPNESKSLLYKNEIFIETPTCNPPLFNYVSFIKVLSIHKIKQMIKYVLENQQITSPSKRDVCRSLQQEILKMFMMNQSSSLKSLEYYSEYSVQDALTFTNFPGAKDCLENLSELYCSSDIHSEFFYGISQICGHKIQTLTITFKEFISNGLANLISSQKRLKHLKLIQAFDGKNYGKSWEEIIPSLTELSNDELTKLYLCSYSDVPISFISKFKNLQELNLSFKPKDALLDNFNIDFNQLQYINFTQLKILKFLDKCPKVEMLIKFLEINGKNLDELYIADNDDSLNLSIAKCCPKLKSLYTIFRDDETETLKVILNSCQYLESIRVWCGDEFLNEKEFLEILAEHSPKNLRIYYVCDGSSEISSEELEEIEDHFS